MTGPTLEDLERTEALEAVLMEEMSRAELIEGLREIAASRAELDQAELEIVSLLRPHTPWQTIADGLGINKTTAMRRFAQIG